MTKRYVYKSPGRELFFTLGRVLVTTAYEKCRVLAGLFGNTPWGGTRLYSLDVLGL
jgi:hypothetical protein